MHAYRISYRVSLIAAFMQGMIEFRLGMTTSQPDDDHYYAYDSGRELAHRLTFRRFDDCA